VCSGLARTVDEGGGIAKHCLPAAEAADASRACSKLPLVTRLGPASANPEMAKAAKDNKKVRFMMGFFG
jgi:hypothetical protein